jgi:hypothetical protein
MILKRHHGRGERQLTAEGFEPLHLENVVTSNGTMEHAFFEDAADFKPILLLQKFLPHHTELDPALYMLRGSLRVS